MEKHSQTSQNIADRIAWHTYIYLMRIIAGLEFFWHIDPVILHSQALMRLVGFNGSQLAQEVIQQAIDNLGGHATLVSIAIDRGFMDGKLLWWLTSQKITFFIPAKSNQCGCRPVRSLQSQ